MSYNINNSEIKAAVDAGILISGPQTPNNEPGSIPYAVVPADAKVVSLEEYLHDPIHLEKEVTLHDPASLIAYVNAFREPGSVIFFDEPQRTFEAVLDYHHGGKEYTLDPSEPGAPTARWCEHKASFTVRQTPEWIAWTKSNRVQMGQVQFAQFIEEHVQDVGAAYGDTLQGIAITFEVKKDVQFSSGQRLDNGETKLLYAETLSGTAVDGTVTIPKSFTLMISPYHGGPFKEVECRFRWRFNDRALILWYEMVRLETIVEEALSQIAAAVSEGTGVHVLAGTA